MAPMAGYFSLVFLLFSISGISLNEALNGGFTVELIHRDSSRSPFYLSTETQSQRVANALRRSIKRSNHFNSAAVSANNAESNVIANLGEYLMSYSVGTPPFHVWGIVDTGSDIIWMQCMPCLNCYNQTSPMFNPSKSKTYENIPCSSAICKSLEDTSCSTNDEKNCKYSISYGDHSFSKGDLVLETLTLGSTNGPPIPFPRTVIGCGHNNTVTFEEKSSGIVGLGGGSVSLISQMGSSIGGKFSYCLVPEPFFSQSNSSSKLNFGDDAVVSDHGTVSTPIVPKEPKVFYYLTLEAVSVGDKRIEFGRSSSDKNEKGNIIIDSGSTLTHLPYDLYSRLESAVADVVKLERGEDPEKQLTLCYKAILEHMEVPVITAHFSGADVKLNALNTFVQVSDEVVCFAFIPTKGLAIFGNLVQMNFLVGYDLQKKIVSFKPTDCTKQ